VLAALAAHTGEVVSSDGLIDALWGDRPPRSAGKQVQNVVLRLRKRLGQDLIETRPGGYLLRLEPDSVDLCRFERLVADGRERASEGDLVDASAAFESALELWRGRALSDLADWPGSQAEIVRLEELRRCIEEELAGATLALGRHREWLPRLEALVTEEPLRERRWALLMTALHRSGRQADALRAFQRARAVLSDLGLEPGTELAAVERAIAADDASLRWSSPASAPEPDLPSGLLTFLLTDVEGSSALWERAPTAMAEALERHDALIEQAVGDAGGSLLGGRGDEESTVSVFTSARAAVGVAVAIHARLAAEPWPPGIVVRLRVAVHTGEAHERDGGYQGTTVHRAARLRDLGSGGQVLLSEAVAALIRDELPAGWDLIELGERALRGLARPERVFALSPAGAVVGSDATVVARSCPYMGLLPFSAEDERLFFGRDDLVSAMTERLVHDRFLAIVGASGSGKSSVLRAGLVAGLERGDGPDGQRWTSVVLTPTARPLAQLAACVAPLCDTSAAGLLQDLEADPRSLDLALRQAVASRPGEMRIALVVDQLEELFTLCHDDGERASFLDALVDAASDPQGHAAVAVGLRGDHFGHGATHRGLAAMLEAHSLLLGSMDEDGLRAAIEGPAAVAGLVLEPGLADVILRDVTGEPGGLPLLSHALVEVWSRREGHMLTVDGYRSSGGVAGAIARTADAVYEHLDADQQRTAREIFVRLTELGEGRDHTARRATVHELARDDPTAATRVETVLGILAASRLVTTSAGSVEIAHEALIREWPRLRGWLQEDRDGLRLMRHLTVASLEWDQRGRDHGDLYRGSRLAAALEWQAGHGEALSPLEREFLDASRGAQDAQVREIAARNRRLRGLLAGTGVALVLALVAGALAVGQRDRVAAARDRAAAAAAAETVGRLVAQSRVAQDTSLDLALLLAVEANRRSDTPETRGALQSALVSNPQLLGFLHGGGAAYTSVSVSSAGVIAAGTGAGTVDLWDGVDRRLVGTLAVGTDAGRGADWSDLVAVAFSPDGSTLAVSSDGDRTLSLWDVETRGRIGQPLTTAVASHAGSLFAFSADGRRLSAALASGEIATWDVTGGAEVGERITSDDGAELRSVAYSADGRWLAAGGASGRVTLHDAGTREPAQPTLDTGHATLISSLAFDRHGERLVAASPSSGLVFGWDLTDGARIPFAGDTANPSSAQEGVQGDVALSPSEDVLAAGGVNGVHLIDLAAPDAPPVPVATHGGVVTKVAYSPDGGWIATANSGGSISLLDTVGRRKLGQPIPTGHQAVLFSPAGDLAAAPDYRDGSVVLLDPWDGREVRRLSPPGMQPIPPGAWPIPAFSEDGTLLAFGGVTGHATIFDVATGEVVQTLPTPPATTTRPLFPAPESYVGVLAFSPDGTKLVAASLETGTVFDLGSGRQIAHPSGWGIMATSATFTHDGSLVAISGYDQQTLTFDPETGQPVGEPIPDAWVAVNGPEGTLVTTGTSGTMRLIDLATRRPVGPPIVGRSSQVVTIDVLPGGAELVASYGWSQIAQLFDIATGHAIGDPFPSLGPLGVASVSPDGKVLVTGDGARMVHWNLDQASWREIACEVAGRDLDPAEWTRYLPHGGSYRATCGTSLGGPGSLIGPGSAAGQDVTPPGG
jgi:WD40 repeat protein/DNA-binding SARP family transcriptional activator